MMYISLPVDSEIGLILVPLPGWIGQIVSILLVIALLFPPQGSTRSLTYAIGSSISFFIGNAYGLVILNGPGGGGMYFTIGWYNILGFLTGVLLLILAVFQYRKDREMQLSMESTN